MFEKHIGVDLGTVNVLVYDKGEGDCPTRALDGRHRGRR